MKLSEEPVVTAAGITSLIAAVIVFLRLMGWLPLNDEQANALMVVVTLALPILGALVARKLVRPIAKMSDQEKQAMQMAMVKKDVPE